MVQGPYNEEIKAKVIELHTVHRLGLKAIAKYFNNKPSKTTVEKILSKAGVYRGPERMEEQQRAREKRQQQVLEAEKEWRHRMATCLWNLRKNIPVERTCIQNGWNKKSIWNKLRERPYYYRLRSSLHRPYTYARKQQKRTRVSRLYPLEADFIRSIDAVIKATVQSYEKEPTIPDSNLRADFRIGRYLLECKVDSTHGKLIHCVGQCWIYKLSASAIPVVITPDDVTVREPFRRAMLEAEAIILTETEFSKWIRAHGGVQESSCHFYQKQVPKSHRSV